LPVHIPSLRERKEDIPVLTDYFVDKFNEKLNRNVKVIDSTVREILLNYHWPGNIRELENLVERLVLLAQDDIIKTGDLPPEIKLSEGVTQTADSMKPGESFKDIVKNKTEEIERQMIARVLEECDGNVSKAALQLGLSRKGLQLKMIKYDLRK
jgi:Nif-specific regulatory protein